MTTTRNKIEEMLKDLERPYKTLTAWELGFLESVSDQFSRSGKLSSRQVESLTKIHLEKVLQ